MGQNNETICPGDSGSPIIWEDPNDNNRAYLVGIASQKENAYQQFKNTCLVKEIHSSLLAASAGITGNLFAGINTEYPPCHAK